MRVTLSTSGEFSGYASLFHVRDGGGIILAGSFAPT